MQMNDDDPYARCSDENRDLRINDDVLGRIEQLKYLQETFECRRCGECCRQESVAFTEKDIDRAAHGLNLPRLEFIERYGLCQANDPSELVFYRLPIGMRGICPFNSDRDCTIYEARPQVCRGFPFLTPGNVENAFNMKDEIVLGSNCRQAIEQMSRVFSDTALRTDRDLHDQSRERTSEVVPFRPDPGPYDGTPGKSRSGTQ
jgi:Fe-S-cluster containining protein